MRPGFFLLAAISVLGGLSNAQENSSSVIEFVRSSAGFIRGQTDGHVDKFLGIPYAAPPVGDLRWEPPAPPQGWTGIRDATVMGSECTQLEVGKGGQVVKGSEDCLYLNV